MKIHFISIGGAVMHNLALALHQMGNQVSGSDDEIFEPAKSRLKKAGILPKKIGWDVGNITNNIDEIILGMHARIDNPELIKAKELNIPIYSFPEYIRLKSENKKRIVIGGSHGKTTTTAMLMHVLKYLRMDFDYMVGSQLKGFETMVKLTDAPIIILEGDEYLTSPLDLRPKFHLYDPSMAMLTGIAWDHINVFPTFENYLEQFSIFISKIPDGAPLVYFKNDEHLQEIVKPHAKRLKLKPYTQFEYENTEKFTEIMHDDIVYELKVFGEHNLQNMNGAMLLAQEIGIEPMVFLSAMQSFEGTSKRLELVKETDQYKVYKDFAHSPSKVKATVEAVRQRYPKHYIVACLELHTFSSLNKDFMTHYTHTLQAADIRIVYYDSHVFELKKMEILDKSYVEKCFADNTKVITDKTDLENIIASNKKPKTIFLMMSSGDFNGIKLDGI